MISSNNFSGIEVYFDFDNDNIGIDKLDLKASIVKKFIQEILKKLPEAKITLDVYYSIKRYLNVDSNDIRDSIEDTEYIQKMTNKDIYRKFEVLNKRNVTSTIELNNYQKNILDFQFEVDIENICINLDNIYDEILNSVYFYYLQYIKLHYSILKKVDLKFLNQNKKFYNMIKEKY